MKKLLVASLLIFSVCASSFGSGRGQTDDEKRATLKAFEAKIHQLELYNLILPVLMTKDQLRTILKSIEKCRQRSHDLLTVQYKAIMTLQKGVDDAIAAAQEKGAVPPDDLVNQLYRASQGALMVRKGILEEDTDDIYEVVTKTLDKGQLLAMANTLNPKEFPDLLKNPDQVKQEDKIKIFIRGVLLDDSAYPLLVKMSI